MTPNLRTMTTYPYTRRHRHPRMDAPPIDPGIRSLRFQGAGTIVHYRKVRFPGRTVSRSIPGKSGRDLTIKGKERESTGSASARKPDPAAGSDDDDGSEGWTQARLDGWVKSTWIDGRQPGIVGWRDPDQQRDRGRVYWVFALDDEGVQRVDSTIPEDLLATKGSFDLTTLTTCMHGSSPRCPLCGPTGSISSCVRQPGQSTRPSEVFAGLALGTDPALEMEVEEGGFPKLWTGLAEALIDHYAWVEGWMVERLASVQQRRERRQLRRGRGDHTAHSPAAGGEGPTMILRGKEHQSGLDLEIHLSTSEWEDVSESTGTETPNAWDRTEKNEVGRTYRLWPSEERARYIKRIDLDEDERDVVLRRIADQVGSKTAERLREEDEWTLLWIREDLPRARDLGGTIDGGQKGWYCVWPRGWLVRPDDLDEDSVRKDSITTKRRVETRDESVSAGPIKPAETVARFLAALRSDTPLQPQQEPQEMDFEMLNDLAPPADGLPSLFDTQSWLDYDPVLDMASEMADTPATLGVPTPLGRTEADHPAPINHDSVDAISSKILSPTANPTPAAQRDWDMMNTAYEMSQNEDVITENDFNFFDAPHTSMFDAFDESKEEGMRFDLNKDQGKGPSTQSGFGDKEDWVETAEEMTTEPEPAPPYTAEAIEPTPPIAEVVRPEMPLAPIEDADMEDESDDLFGENEDDSDEHSFEADSRADLLAAPEDASTREPFGTCSEPLNVAKPAQDRVLAPARHQPTVSEASLPAQRPYDSIDVRYIVDNVASDLVPLEHRPLKWASKKNKLLLHNTKRLAIYLVKAYGDGTVRDRKGHKLRLRKAYEARRRFSAYDTDDARTDSNSDSEQPDQDEDEEEDWMRYETDTAGKQKHQVSAGPIKIMEKFDLSRYAWTCPNMMGTEACQRPASVMPTAAYPQEVALACTTAIPSISDRSPALSQGFREWLALLVVEDPALRDCLLGSTRPQVRPPRSRDSKDVRVRLGHCGRSTDMDGNSVRFWRQLGLTPFSGQKDVSTLVFFDSAYASPSEAMEWHSELDRAYSARGYGRSVKMDELFSFDTTFDFRSSGIQTAFDTIRKRQLRHIPTVIVVLLQDELSTTLTTLQELYDQYAAIYPAETAAKTILQPAFFTHRNDSSSTDRLASCIYHRISTTYTPQHPTVSTPPTVSLYAPAFTLCSAYTTPAARFAVQWPAPTTNPHDTGRLIHAAYTVTPSNALVAVCMDEYGEWWTFDCIQLGSGPQAVKQGLEKFWQLVQGYAANATIEWRFVIARLGQCPPQELHCWLSVMETLSNIRPAQFALVQCVATSFPSMSGSNTAPQWSNVTGDRIDFAGQAAPVVSAGSFPCGQIDIGTGGAEFYETQHLLSSTSAQSTICQTDGEMLKDVQSNFDKLSKLGSLRWGFSPSGQVPPHIEAVHLYRELNLA